MKNCSFLRNTVVRGILLNALKRFWKNVHFYGITVFTIVGAYAAFENKKKLRMKMSVLQLRFLSIWRVRIWKFDTKCWIRILISYSVAKYVRRGSGHWSQLTLPDCHIQNKPTRLQWGICNFSDRHSGQICTSFPRCFGNISAPENYHVHVASTCKMGM